MANEINDKGNNKLKEIVILSYCEKPKKVGFDLYKCYANKQDKDFEDEFSKIHPTKDIEVNNKKIKIQFIEIKDCYWPAIKNICNNSEGVIFAIDMDDDSKEGGSEFIEEWLINLDDLDKYDIKKVVVGIIPLDDQTNKTKIDAKKIEINKICEDNKIEDVYYGKIINNNGDDEIKAALNKIVELVYKSDDSKDGAVGKKTDDDEDELDEYLNKYKDF
jgi:hypothetical protein